MKYKSYFKRFAACGMAAAMISMGCVYVPAEDVASVSEAGTEEAAEEKSVMDAVSGMDDLYIVQGAESFDFLAGILYDPDIVDRIEADSESVDLQTCGAYDITYHVFAKKAALDAYIAGTALENVEDGAEPEDMPFTKSVTVLSTDDAAKKADEGALVFGPDGEIIPKTDGSKAMRRIEAPKSMEGKDASPVNASTGKPVLVEKDMTDVLTGVTDRYVLAGTENTTYLQDILYDGDIVKNIAVDSSAVDTNTPGRYEVVYQVTVDRAAMDTYANSIVKVEKADATDDNATNETASSTSDNANAEPAEAATEASDAEAEPVPETTADVAQAEPAKDEPADEQADTSEKEVTDEAASTEQESADTADATEESSVTVTIVKGVEVVTEEDAVKLADENKPVYTNDDKTVPKSDGTEVKPDVTVPASVISKNTEPIDAATGKPVPKEDKPSEEKPETVENKPAQQETPVPQQESAPKNDAPANNQPAQPVHEHTWVAQTTTVNHPAETKTVHHDAQYNTVHHDAQYTTVHHDAQYNTVHHDAVTHQEPNYIYESHCSVCGAANPTLEHLVDCDASCIDVPVQSGSTTVVDSPAWDEQVQVSAAWDEQVETAAAWDEQVLVSDAWDETVVVRDAWTETVTTGYVCSGCGATK